MFPNILDDTELNQCSPVKVYLWLFIPFTYGLRDRLSSFVYVWCVLRIFRGSHNKYFQGHKGGMLGFQKCFTLMMQKPHQLVTNYETTRENIHILWKRFIKWGCISPWECGSETFFFQVLRITVIFWAKLVVLCLSMSWSASLPRGSVWGLYTFITVPALVCCLRRRQYSNPITDLSCIFNVL